MYKYKLIILLFFFIIASINADDVILEANKEKLFAQGFYNKHDKVINYPLISCLELEI